jgi:hypothetical protein
VRRTIPFQRAGVTLPIEVEGGVADLHVVEPFALPGVEVGRADAGDGGAEGAVGSRAVGAEEDAEVERDPWVEAEVQVGEMASQSAHTWLLGLFSSGSSSFFCVAKSSMN